MTNNSLEKIVSQNIMSSFEMPKRKKYLPQVLSEEEMMDAAEAVGTLVNIYISNRLSTESILMDFRDETGLSETTSRVFLLYFEKYYQELSTNYIIGMLNTMLHESEQ